MTQTTKNINSRPSRRRRSGSPVRVVIVLFVLLILVAAAVLAFLNRDKISSIFSPRVETQAPSDDKREEKREDKTSDNNAEEDKKDDTPVREAEKTSNAQYEGENANNYGTITGVINASASGDGTINVRVIIDQMLGSGSCTIVVRHSSGATNTVSAPVETGPSSSICIATIGAQSGRLTITADVSADGKKGTISGEANV